mgnify:CR=1 FL=1
MTNLAFGLVKIGRALAAVTTIGCMLYAAASFPRTNLEAIFGAALGAVYFWVGDIEIRMTNLEARHAGVKKDSVAQSTPKSETD